MKKPVLAALALGLLGACASPEERQASQARWDALTASCVAGNAGACGVIAAERAREEARAEQYAAMFRNVGDGLDQAAQSYASAYQAPQPQLQTSERRGLSADCVHAIQSGNATPSRINSLCN